MSLFLRYFGGLCLSLDPNALKEEEVEVERRKVTFEHEFTQNRIENWTSCLVHLEKRDIQKISKGTETVMQRGRTGGSSNQDTKI